MPFSVGISGNICAGKDSAVSYIRQLAVQDGFSVLHLNMSDSLRAAMTELELKRTRGNQQRFAQVVDTEWPGHLAEMLEGRIRRSVADLTIISGLRWKRHLYLLGVLQGTSLFVKAGEQFRYERRVVQSNKVGRAELTFENFCLLNQAPTEIELQAYEDAAMYQMINEGSINEYQDKLRGLYRQLEPLIACARRATTQ